MNLDPRALYEQEANSVFAFLGRFGFREGDLEDAVHDTFVTAMDRKTTYDASRPARPWLMGIAFRVGVAQLRRSRSQPRSVELTEAYADPTQDPERTVDARRALERMQEVLLELNEEQGTAFVQYELQGLTVPEISEAMRVPVATVYSRIRLARVAFTAALKSLEARP